jgi:hypothetical protein
MQVRAAGRAARRSGDRPAAPLAGAVVAGVAAGQGRIDVGEPPARLLEQGDDLLSLESDGRALRVVLVVGVGRLRGGDHAVELTGQHLDLGQRRRPLVEQRVLPSHLTAHRSLRSSRREPVPGSSSKFPDATTRV